MVALSLASLINAKADHKTTLRSADLGLVKRVRTEKRMTGLKPYRVKELFLKLAPAGRCDDDSSSLPIENAPESGGYKDSRRFAGAIAGGQGSRMIGPDVRQGGSLPRVPIMRLKGDLANGLSNNVI